MKEYFILGMRLRWQPSEIDGMPEWVRRGYMVLVEESLEEEDKVLSSAASSPRKSIPRWSRG